MQSRGALDRDGAGARQARPTSCTRATSSLDGTIKAVTPQGLVIVQDVNDPLSLVKQREVRKLLRSLEDAKE